MSEVETELKTSAIKFKAHPSIHIWRQLSISIAIYLNARCLVSTYSLDVCVTDVYARGVNVNLTPLTSKRGALATDARGCSLWRSLLERPPPVWESRDRDPLGTRYEFGRCGPGRGCYICNLYTTHLDFISFFNLYNLQCRLIGSHQA